MSRESTVLVTGGAGYIGSVLCPMLLEAGWHVLVYDRLFYGRGGVEPLLEHPRYTLLLGDIREIQGHPELFERASAVVHLASLSNDPTCELRPALTEEINFQGLVQTAQMAEQHGIERFVFGSSCSVYGSVRGVEAVDEEGPRRPVSLYARTMARAEDWLLSRVRSGFRPKILRQATVFGHSPRMRFDLAINLMVKTAMQQKKIYVMGGGAQWRPFVHVRDTCRVLLAALEGRLSSTVLNVGFDEQNFTIEELARRVARRLGGVEVEVVPEDADRRSYRVRFARLAQELAPFEPSVTVEQGIDEIERAIADGIVSNADAPETVNLRVLKKHMDTPAIAGGEVAFPSFLPFSLPSIGEAEEKAVVEVLRSGWLTTGPRVQKFEERCRERLGCEEAIALSSCTAALHLALYALGVGPGDEVITSPITFPATANVILHLGATPVFADVEPHTLNLDPRKVEERIGPRTKAIVPVHMAGRPCDLDALWALGRRHGLQVVEDAAHAFGSFYRGVPIGQRSPLVAFSFYPIKNLTTIEGGLLAVNDVSLVPLLRAAALHGLSKDAWNRYGAAGSPHWDVVLPGFKYNMTDIEAAVGLCQLEQLGEFLYLRRKYAAVYREALSEVEGIELLAQPDEGHSHHLFVVLVRPEILGVDRDAFVAALRQENIGTGIHFRALHRMQYYRERFGFEPGALPVAESASERLLSLPLYPKMTFEQVERVADAVRKLARHFRETRPDATQ
jgi:dTDP-4-amino-4,6-dideoxygalactose transaminase/nucleoside-diphosphate-sugar epimerase